MALRGRPIGNGLQLPKARLVTAASKSIPCSGSWFFDRGRQVGFVEDVAQVGEALVLVDDGRLAPAAAFVRFHAVGHSPGPLGRPGELAVLSGHVLRRLLQDRT